MIRYEIDGADDAKTVKARLRVNTLCGQLQVEMLDPGGDWCAVVAFDPKGHLTLLPIADRIPELKMSGPGDYITIRRRVGH
jgi:hypothetical protein